MLLTIAVWIVTGLLLLLALIDPMERVVKSIWEILKPLIDFSAIDIKEKFGNWAVVTGSTDGIGKAYAKELAARGVNLVLISRTLEKLESTKEEILKIYPNIKVNIITADFSKGKEVFDNIEKNLRDIPVGILINNVGKNYAYPMYLHEVPEEELWDIININIGAVTMMTRTIITGMKERGKGAIVNVASGSQWQPLPLMTVYAATKVYAKSFSEALRAEYTKYGLTIQHLAPLFVNTKMNAFSEKLQVSSVFVPDATTYARNAIATLGKVDSSTGYWAHGIQQVFAVIPPVWIRTKVGQIMNESFRKDYLKHKAE